MRKYPERPVVGVGAVVLDRGRVLLIKRTHEPLKGEWSLPGGAVEIGETLAQAVEREVREETGLNVRAGPVIEVLDRVHRGGDGRIEYHYVLVDYLCLPINGELQHGSDADAARWVPLDALSDSGLSSDALAVIAKARASAEGSDDKA